MMYKVIKELHEQCKTEDDKRQYLRLINSLKFTARDFKPLLKEVDIFNTLYQIGGSDKTIQKLLEQILLRFDEEKEPSTAVMNKLSKSTSIVDSTQGNQLLSSYVAIFINEMESLINVWQQI